MKSKILKILRETEGYVSGQDLCVQLGVSRTAVWKAIKQLKEQGYLIEAVQNKGYHMVESPDVLSTGEIESRLQTGWLGHPVRYTKEVDSTNNWAKKEAEAGSAQGLVTVTDRQTQGKGRRGRQWKTEEGSNIMMSLLLRPAFLPEKASMLTIVMGLSVAQAIREVTELPVQIKWPNDVIVSGKKLCGILTEMSTQMTCIDYVVIGVGINVNQTEFPEELQDATSLVIESGHPFKRAPLIASVLACFEKNYEIFCKTEDLTGLLEEYNRLLINKDRTVRVLEPQNEYTAVSHGINAHGELLVEREDGRKEAIFAGEVSVRGVYGYT
ncbi:MAG: biotin--[acetyl-CoA-carboxylase] ligase [Lachnospiraceae bacterium]|jgi:BirA family biotin operon repressor/biotin-[acetyl-CoA-carboxylase] ligase